MSDLPSFARAMLLDAQLPLGQPIPALPHAVSCSLPTLHDVIGYEEKNPEVTRHLSSGYPRFLVHPFIRRLADHTAHRLQLTQHHLWLAASPAAASALHAHLASPDSSLLPPDAPPGIALPAASPLNRTAKLFLQNTGTFLSSREAEDRLASLGLLAVSPENLAPASDARPLVLAHLRQSYAPASDDDLFLAPSGMNAIHGTLTSLAALQHPKGRTHWIQFGWLYLDTIALLRNHLTPSPDHYHLLGNVFDLDALRALLERHPDSVAALVTEVPTNPLIQTPDLPALSRLCREFGVALVLDPTIASPRHLDVLPYADVVVNSLTKYTASEGDIILGAVALNPTSLFAPDLRPRLASAFAPVYPRDLARLAAQIDQTDAVLATQAANTARVAAYLSAHPRVSSLHWAHHPASRAHYLALARHPEALCSVLTFSVDLPLAHFYNRTRIPKGPSFGLQTSLLCPFMYLAHYDLVTSEVGRATLRQNGLDPDLLRLAVGCEPIDAILSALAAGLDP